MIRFQRNALVSAAVAALALGAVAFAADKDPILERQATMKKVGESMKALGAMARGDSPFDTASVKVNANRIASAFDHVKDYFPAGSDQGAHETFAKPEIWSNRAEFDATLKSAHEAALELQAIPDEAAFRPALGKLGQNCRSCHDHFRRPKE